MSVSKKALNAMMAGAFVATMAGAAALPGSANAAETEKCYGVVKAGKNGCASADGKHSCEGQAAHDGSGQEWVSVPKGLCEKLVGGKLAAFAGVGAKHDCGGKSDCGHKDKEKNSCSEKNGCKH